MDLSQFGWSADEIALMRQTVANGVPEAEFARFLYVARKTGLDPLSNQIHIVKRNSRNAGPSFTVQTGIDGYRLIADRTGKYAGNDDTVFDNEEAPLRATVTVWKMVDGVRCPFTATARWDQYYPGDGAPGFMWRKMPHVMLGKVAEALALRKGFPADLSGLYVAEEMEQADREDTSATTQATVKAPSNLGLPIVPKTTPAEAPAAPPAEPAAETKHDEKVQPALLFAFVAYLTQRQIPVARALMWARQNVREVTRLDDLTNAEFNRVQAEFRKDKPQANVG